MAYTDIVNVDYTARGNTSTGAAGTTTGSGGELVDQFGSRVNIASGKLAIPNYGSDFLARSVFPTGSPTYELNQICEVDVPTGLVNGDSFTLRVRENVLPSWGSERGAYMWHFYFASALGGHWSHLFAVNNINRGEDAGTNGFNWLPSFSYNSAKPYRLQLKIEVVAGVDTLTTTIFDMTTGSPVQVITRSTTVGAGGAEWTNGTSYGYLAGAGRMAVGNGGNAGYNGGSLFATKIVKLRMATEVAIPPLGVDSPTLTSQTIGTNIVNVATTGGDGGAITRNLYQSLNADYTPGAGTLLGATDGSGNRTHVHGDSPSALPVGGAEIRAYKGAATQSGTTVFSAFPKLIQSVAPSLPAASIIPGLLASQKVILVACGDSNTGGPDITGLTIGPRATKCYDDLRDVFGIPNGNMIRRQTSAQGSRLLRDWQSGSPVYNVSEGQNAGASGMPNGSPNLLAVACNVAETAETANPGSLVVLHFSLGTNDLQIWSAGVPSAAQMIAGFDDIVNYIRVTRGKANWRIVFHGIPYGTVSNINQPANIDGYLSWRRAMLVKSWPSGVMLGAMSEYMGVYNDTSLLADGIHYNSPGYTFAGAEYAKGLAYSALYDAPAVGLFNTAIDLEIGIGF